MRLVRRDPNRPADVFVEPIGKDAGSPITARAIPIPRPLPREEEIPSSTDLALDPLDEALEAVHTSELLLEPYETARDAEATPITGVSPWQRAAPPPLPLPPEPTDTEGNA